MVEEGDIGYWPQDACFCIFFGPTPNSKPGEIRPASSVILIGNLSESAQEKLKKVQSGTRVTIALRVAEMK